MLRACRLSPQIRRLRQAPSDSPAGRILEDGASVSPRAVDGLDDPQRQVKPRHLRRLAIPLQPAPDHEHGRIGHRPLSAEGTARRAHVGCSNQRGRSSSFSHRAVACRSRLSLTSACPTERRRGSPTSRSNSCPMGSTSSSPPVQSGWIDTDTGSFASRTASDRETSIGASARRNCELKLDDGHAYWPRV